MFFFGFYLARFYVGAMDLLHVEQLFEQTVIFIVGSFITRLLVWFESHCRICVFVCVCVSRIDVTQCVSI